VASLPSFALSCAGGLCAGVLSSLDISYDQFLGVGNLASLRELVLRNCVLILDLSQTWTCPSALCANSGSRAVGRTLIFCSASYSPSRSRCWN
jgi:hypothetical protein